MAKRVAVIGAGPAGCHAAYQLQKHGFEVVIFERESQVGGRTYSWDDQGWVIDSGAGFVTNFYKTFWPLIHELGLSTGLTTLSRSNALSDGTRTADFTVGSIGSFLAFPFLGASAKARMAWQSALIAVRYQKLDLSRPETLAPWDNESARDAALRLFGEQAYHYLVRPGIEPFWYFSCADISRALLLGLMAKASTAKFFAFRQGMSLLCRRLVEGLQVQTAVAVESIRRQGKQFICQHQGASPATDQPFDGLVLATTATVAAQLTASLDEQLVPPLVRKFLTTQSYVPNIHAAFLVDNRAALPPMSSLFPCGPHQSRIAAINFNSHKQQQRPSSADNQDIVGVFLTAQESEACLSMPDQELSEHAWQSARAFCPCLPSQSRLYRLVRRNEAIPLHSVGRYREAALVLKAQAGSVVFAGDYLASATVDGALATGQRAAEALASHLLPTRRL